jgi:hypothetical protein
MTLGEAWWGWEAGWDIFQETPRCGKNFYFWQTNVTFLLEFRPREQELEPESTVGSGCKTLLACQSVPPGYPLQFHWCHHHRVTGWPPLRHQCVTSSLCPRPSFVMCCDFLQLLSFLDPFCVPVTAGEVTLTCLAMCHQCVTDQVSTSLRHC